MFARSSNARWAYAVELRSLDGEVLCQQQMERHFETHDPLQVWVLTLTHIPIQVPAPGKYEVAIGIVSRRPGTAGRNDPLDDLIVFEGYLARFGAPTGEWEGVSFTRRFRRLRARCARPGLVKEEKNGENLVLHSTRHTRNVLMIHDEGIDEAIASKEMGHAHISTTVRHCLRLTDAVRRRRLERGDGPGG